MIDPKVRIAGVACSSAVIGIGVFMFIRGSIDTSNWPSTEGIIQSSKVSRSGGTRGHSARGPEHLEVQYAYEVANTLYVSRKVSLVSDWVPDDLWRKDRRPWAVGARVQVFYDPKHPARAVLFPGRLTLGQKGASMVVMGVGTAFALVFAFGKEQPSGSQSLPEV